MNSEELDETSEINSLGTLTDEQFFEEAEKEINTFKLLNDRDGIFLQNKKTTSISQLQIKNNINLDTAFFSTNELKIKKFDEIYLLLSKCNMLIFVDDKKMKKVRNNSCLSRKKKLSLTQEDFDGCTFFGFAYSKFLLELMSVYINKKQEAETNNIEICQDQQLCNEIIFDENVILKNSIYKKLEIQNKILFIPIKKYKLKYTEYKLRGFCQIAEELGAKNIEIKFQKVNSKSSSVNTKTAITAEQIIAGNLGFGTKDDSSDKENRNYTLDYPSSNTINLNEEAIKSKIHNKQLIVNEIMFNSNLELQYLIAARCRHYITKYSAVFTLDTSQSIDKKLISKFKTHGIELDLEYNISSSFNDSISIVTDVTFSNDEDNKENLNGCKVNLDETGFNFLIKSLSDENFKTCGIYKIIDFINYYIDKNLVKYNRLDYNNVKKIQNKINENLILSEYAEILTDYFDNKSQWLHLVNFIDLLRFKTKSYDKLGYLIMVNKIYQTDCEKLTTMLKFIQEYCTKNGLENKYWKMLQPYNKKTFYYLKEKVTKDYNFLNEFNWFDFKSFIECIKNYNYDIEGNGETNNEENYFSYLIENMNLGFSYWEYHTHFLQYIKRKYHSLHYKNNTNKEINLNLEFFDIIFNYESFKISKILTVKKLEEFIKKKIEKIILGKKLRDIFMKLIDINEKNNITILIKLYDYFYTEDFDRDNFGYFRKKLNIILGDSSSERMIALFKDETTTLTPEGLIKLFIDKLLLYNDKLEVRNIPKNNLGFDHILVKFNNGIKEQEFQKTIKPFILKMKENITNKKQSSINISLDEFSKLTNYYEFLSLLKEKEFNNEEIIPKFYFEEIF